jgi:octaprenyl-diphosphate synthase
VTIETRIGVPVAAALRDIQAPIRDQLDCVPDEMWRIVSADAPIVEAVREHLKGMHGKMFRPTLLLLASAVDGNPEPRAVTLAAVAELVHLTSVVHDDSVDHSVLRRGKPTINALFSHEVAVLMGDYLFSKAIAELVRLGDMEPLRAFTLASNTMTLGELRQLSSYDALNFSEADYDVLNRAKTASLIGATCEMGALAGAPQFRQQMRRFGDSIGMAFQVADDLIDYTEAESVTGKPSGNDLKEHLPHMSAAQRSRVDALFANPTPDDAEIHDVVAIVSECGGLEYARRKGEEFAQQAEESLVGVPDSDARQAMSDVIAYVMDRRS